MSIEHAESTGTPFIAAETTAVNSQIDDAMAKVSASVKRLEKLHKNQHGGYQFASIDDFKDEIRPILSFYGLWLHATQKAFDLVPLKVSKEEKIYAKFTFEFIIRHKSGEFTSPSEISVCLPYTGAQTTGAALSYAIKECVYKGLLQVSSGDLNEEADLQEQVQLSSLNRIGKVDAKPLWEALQREMRDIETTERSSAALADWWKNNTAQTDVLPLDWFTMIKKEYADTWRKLKANEDADVKSPQDEF